VLINNEVLIISNKQNKPGGLTMTKQEKQEKFVSDMTRWHGKEFNFIKLGMMVKVNGHIGTIAGFAPSGNLYIVFANRLRFPGKRICHPKWEIKYFDNDYKLIKRYSEKSNGIKSK